MADLIRESSIGQVIRFITRNKVLLYPEEDPDFRPPWQEAQALEKELEIKDGLNTPETPPVTTNGDHPNNIENRPGSNTLSHIATARSDVHGQNADLSRTRTITRTRTREATAPYSEDRFEVEKQETAQRTVSSVIIPQKTAEGVTLVDWYTTDDPANPQNWSNLKKGYVSFIIWIYTFAVYASSAIYTSSEPGVMKRFGVGDSKAALGLSLYVIGYSLGPMLFSPMSEIPLFGRNVPYITSMAFFLILGFPLAVVDNYPGLLVLRFLTGFMGSPCLATGGATMQDMYDLLLLPYALSTWVSAAFCAPALGPLLSGFAVMAKGWRWSLWEITWMAGPTFLFMFLTLPETSAPNILLRRARRLRKLTGDETLKSQSEIDQGNKKFSAVVRESLLVPILICMKDPAVLFTNVYTSLIYGIYYSFFEAFPIAYIGIYGFNIGELGIVFLCIIVGCVVGITIYFSYLYFYLTPDIKKNGLRAQEHRLVPALFAVFLMPSALFWFGWTAKPDIHWIVSIIAIGIYAVGAFVLFQCIFMYLPLTYPQYAASLFAANDLCRGSLAAGAVIFSRPLYINLGLGRGTSILGGLMWGGVIGIWLIWYFGAKLRAKSTFATA